MANKQLFKSTPGHTPRAVSTDEKGNPTRNAAGGVAYTFTPKHALAQFAATGCLSSTYYASAEKQLKDILDIASQVDSEFLAKTAIYAREQSFMKDMPALLVAILFARTKTDPEASPFFQAAFHKAITNGKMLRNFVQIVRSGVTGRKSLGHKGLVAIEQWLKSRDPNRIFYESVGTSPSMADVLKLAHPTPATEQHRALFGYLCGLPSETAADATQRERNRFYKFENLPELVQQYERFKQVPDIAVTGTGGMPAVPFQMLTQLPLTPKHWTHIALNGGWHMVRMNLNTFARHGVFNDKAVVKILADKLRDADEIRRARVFPYQLFMAYMATDGNTVPTELTLALQDAMEIATQNVPKFEGDVWVFPDVSGSMGSAVTGNRPGATSKMRCIDVAALVGACVLRNNPTAKIIPVDVKVHTDFKPNPRDSVVTNAQRLAAFGGGGTHLSLALEHLIYQGNRADLVIFVSDNESWMDRAHLYHGGTSTRKEALWQQIRVKNPNAKMINIDLQPNNHTQAPDGNGVLNIGGFSDTVWQVISGYVSGDANSWVKVIENYGANVSE